LRRIATWHRAHLFARIVSRGIFYLRSTLRLSLRVNQAYAHTHHAAPRHLASRHQQSSRAEGAPRAYQAAARNARMRRMRAVTSLSKARVAAAWHIFCAWRSRSGALSRGCVKCAAHLGAAPHLARSEITASSRWRAAAHKSRRITPPRSCKSRKHASCAQIIMPSWPSSHASCCRHAARAWHHMAEENDWRLHQKIMAE